MSADVDEKMKEKSIIMNRQEKEKLKEIQRKERSQREHEEKKKRKSEAEKARQLYEEEKKMKKEKKKKEETMLIRHKEAEKARLKLERLDTQIKEAHQRIKEQEKPMHDMDDPIAKKKKDLKELRDRITSMKGDGLQEDPNFHIDGSRDPRGHTFLMLAAQNEDIITASLCFELNANSMVTNSEGFMAIDYSHFFSFDSITELILQVCIFLCIMTLLCIHI